MIRRLLRDDINELYSIRLEALRLEPTAFGGSYQEESAKGSAWLESVLDSGGDHNVIFGAFHEGKLVGTAGVYLQSLRKLSHKATLWGVYVRQQVRQSGVGKELVQAAIEHARANMKARSISLTVESTNVPAVKLYSSLNFKVWGREPDALCVDGAFYAEDHMILMLNEME